jgi:hypothetical protein
VKPVWLTASAAPKRDRRRPFVFTLSGKLTPPPGVATSAACSGRVSVSVVARRKVVKTSRASLKSSCRWSLRVRFTNAGKLGSGRLTFRTTFLGNDALLPVKARAARARAG